MDSIESMIQCTVCYEIMKEPKMLPCLHRFCLPCIKSSISSLGPKINFLCPLCRKPTPIPPGGAGSFKTDFIMKQMVDMVFKQKGLYEKEPEAKKMMLTDPSLLKIDSNIFPKDKWSVDSICCLSDTIVIVGSSLTLNYLLAFTVTGILCYTSDLAPKGSERETPISSCVAAINDESVVVGCTGRLLIIKIVSSRSDFEHCSELPNNRKPKSIAANSNSIVVHMFSCYQNGVNEKRFLVYDHSLNFLIAIEVDDGDGLVTSICLTDENFYWVDYFTENVFFETLDDFTRESPVEKNKFCKPSTFKCTPLSICLDGKGGYAYVLWRILGETDIVIAGGRDCFDSCRKVLAQYSMNNPQQIVNQIDVDEKSRRVSILNSENMETKKLVIVTKDNLFYTCSNVIK